MSSNWEGLRLREKLPHAPAFKLEYAGGIAGGEKLVGLQVIEGEVA